MIQRKQTVFYLIAILALVIPLMGFGLVSFSVKTAPGAEEVLWTQKITLFGNSYDAEEMTSAGINPIKTVSLYYLNLIIVFLLFITMLSYKNLKRQAMLGKISLWATLVSLGIFLFFIYKYHLVTSDSEPYMELGLVLHFTVAAALFILLGNRGVKKDQKLLASVDRIR